MDAIRCKFRVKSRQTSRHMEASNANNTVESINVHTTLWFWWQRDKNLMTSTLELRGQQSIEWQWLQCQHACYADSQIFRIVLTFEINVECKWKKKQKSKTKARAWREWAQRMRTIFIIIPFDLKRNHFTVMKMI